MIGDRDHRRLRLSGQTSSTSADLTEALQRSAFCRPDFGLCSVPLVPLGLNRDGKHSKGKHHWDALTRPNDVQTTRPRPKGKTKTGSN
ncbi:hypothetical protein NL676_032995 [Syzygium grande]|nr:hypothetical protein NL676_032995 [Syzygium grande]